jgi:vacuolar-type H+-ATPase subunit H
MDEKELVTLTEAVERGKSNSHQIEEIKEEIREIKSEQKAIYDIATSVKLIAQDMTTMKETINDVKEGQSKLEQKIDEVDNKSKIDITEASRDNYKSKILPFLVGGGSVGLIIYVVAEIIKLI